MKKIAALLLTIVVAVSCMSFASFAEDATAACTDGFDFYSMTVHYEQAVVTGFKKVTEAINVKDHDGNALLDENGEQVVLKKGGYLWADATDAYVVPVVCYKDADGNYNYALQYDETPVKSYSKDGFYAVVSKELGIDSSALSVTKNYGLTDIADNTVISSKNAITVYGPMIYYDDAGNPNPNFTKKDGYFLDQRVDENGNNYRIDEDGYVIDANNNWYGSDGHRIELFVEVDGTYKWIKAADRMDANGRLMAMSDITNKYLIEKGVIDYPDEYKNIGDDFDATIDYDKDGEVGTNKDKKEFNTLKKAKASWLKNTDAMTYVIDYKDYNGDGKKTTDDLVGYKAADAVFTGDDIQKREIAGEIYYITGTPDAGQPLTTVKIKNITLEIDAMGTQLYADVASDPQQANEIIVTYGDVYANVKAALDKIAADPTKEYNDGAVIGAAKCVTTKTEAAAETTGYPSSMKSIELTLEEGVTIPQNAMIYFNFVVKANQAENEKNYVTKSNHGLLTINRSKLDVENLPTKEVEETEEKKGCFGTISGGVAVVSVLAMAFVALKKKED